jgi:hypothetical protein
MSESEGIASLYRPSFLADMVGISGHLLVARAEQQYLIRPVGGQADTQKQGFPSYSSRPFD